MPKLLTQEDYIAHAVEVHGDKYDYSKTVYKSAHEDVIITCKIHGDFPQRAYRHTHLKNGCFKCSHIVPVDREKFLSVSVSKHGDKYDYSEVDFIDRYTPVKIACSIHGDFHITPKLHMRGRGCQLCGEEKRVRDRTHNTETYIFKAKKIHGDTYNYDKVDYLGDSQKVIITCLEHGDFPQHAGSHLQNHGCPHCKKTSKGEIAIEKELKELNARYEREYSLPGTRYRYDFYLPDHNLLLEYDGRQHFVENSWDGVGGLKEVQKRDQEKNQLAQQHGYTLKRISYKEFKDIPTIIKKALTIMSKEEKNTGVKFVGFADGSAKPNPGHGGYGVFGYTYKNTERSKNIKHPAHGTLSFTPDGVLKEKGDVTIEVLRIVEVIHAMNNPSSTNNEAELRALVAALTKASEVEGITDIKVYTDSSYVINSYKDDIDNWKLNGWKTRSGKDVSHISLMLELDAFKIRFKELDINVDLQWVKGHGDSHGNVMADMFSVIGSNSAKRQMEEGLEFNPIVYDSVMAYADYKKSYVGRDVLYFLRDMYFTSNEIDDNNFCFLSTSDNPNNKGKRDTASMFMTSVGYVPEMLAKFRNLYRKVRRNYVTTCCVKISKLDNKEFYRLGHLLNVEDMLVKKFHNGKTNYHLIRDDQPFIFETNVDYPFMIDANKLFNNTIDIVNEDKTNNPNIIVRDITERIVKDKKIVLSNKDKSVDFTDVVSDAVQLKQKLLMAVGYDIPSYLALKSIEEDIQQVLLILESKPNNNYCTLFVNVVLANRSMYSVNIENKYLRSTTHVV